MTRAYHRGVNAETAACAALAQDGWVVLAQRLRTGAGEIDIVAAKPDMLAIVAVKARRTLADAAPWVPWTARKAFIIAIAILFGSNGTTAPLRRRIW